MKKKILVNYQIPAKGLSALHKYYEVYYPSRTALTREETLRLIPSYHGLFSNYTISVDKDIIHAGKNLEIISNYGVGYNNIDIKTASEKKILVCNTPQSVCEPTAEICMGLLVSAMRNISGCNLDIRTNKNFKWGLMENLGFSLSGKTLGIIGLGNIGKAVARRALAFGMKIIYYNRKPLPKSEEEKYKAAYVDFKTLLQTADAISLNTPLTDKTFHLIDKDALSLMKKNAFIVNTSRGSVIHEQALVDALKSKKIAGAALDVFENEPEIHPELLKMSNVVLTAHMGSSTFEARTEVGIEASNNFIAFWENKAPINVVNKEILNL